MHFPVWREWKLIAAIELVIIKKFLAMHFPVWREWKQMVAVMLCQRYQACDALSRLKGTETGSQAIHHDTQNPCHVRSRLKGMETSVFGLPRRFQPSLAMCFPVWREWKLFRDGFFYPIPECLWIRVPVWREWKQVKPFVYRTCHLKPCDAISRLKGMETIFLLLGFPKDVNNACAPVSRLKGMETST